MRLDQDAFLAVIKNAPLVSIDLIIKNQRNNYLLGRRVNEPAKGQYFVPGGVVHKGQTLADAFADVARNELGIEIPFESAIFLGVYEHIYDNNFAGIDDLGTHYVVLAYEITLPDIELDRLPRVQHSEWSLMPVEKLLSRSDVHENAKLFFKTAAILNQQQYQIVASRRQNYDNLVWQTPVVSLTAQAFLLTIALGAETANPARFVAALLSLLAALASLQLMAKHRHMEVLDSRILEEHEKNSRKLGYSVISGRVRTINDHISWLARRSSYRVWMALLVAFAFAAGVILLYAGYMTLISSIL